MMNLIKVSKIYRIGHVEVLALNEVSVGIDRGEFVAIVGPSGSGKTTLLDILGCLSRPTSGDYWFDGKLVSRLPDDELTYIRNRKIGFVFQTFQLLPRKTVLENVQLPMLYAGVPWKAQRHRALQLLRDVGLEDRAHHLPTQLSGGQQQRVAIARALANTPDVILADEPTGNLDSRSGQDILGLFQRLHESGQTLVMITHDQQIAEQAQRRVMIADGRIVADDRASQQAPVPV
ncbi:MAG: ABC transporter ATP-binding protein [Nitrospirae bacterium]|nr:MAG: ABC transporter ATP-binding protein [Nitrospirota bacterium]